MLKPITPDDRRIIKRICRGIADEPRGSMVRPAVTPGSTGDLPVLCVQCSIRRSGSRGCSFICNRCDGIFEQHKYN